MDSKSLWNQYVAHELTTSFFYQSLITKLFFFKTESLLNKPSLREILWLPLLTPLEIASCLAVMPTDWLLFSESLTWKKSASSMLVSGLVTQVLRSEGQHESQSISIFRKVSNGSSWEKFPSYRCFGAPRNYIQSYFQS